MRLVGELARAEQERDALGVKHVEVLRDLELLHAEAALMSRQIATLRHDLDRANNRAEAAERARQWIVARDGGRHCERCEGEVRRGEAYELEPGTGGLLLHIHCPRPTKHLNTVKAELAEARAAVCPDPAAHQPEGMPNA